MKDKIVSLEIAKLAKEKGFDIPTCSYYYEDGEFKEFEINDTYGYYGEEYTVSIEEFYNNWNDKWKTTKKGNRCLGCDDRPKYLETFSAPTQAFLQKWLREVHNIDVVINTLRSGSRRYYKFFISEQSKDVYKDIDSKDTYEEALEIGLQEALKLI